MSAYLEREGVDVARTRTAYDEMAQLNAQYGELATDVGLAAGGALPPPFGTAADLASLGRSLWKGDWGGALLDVVGLVPILGDGAKAGKIAKRLDDLRRAIDTAATGLRRAFTRTNAAAGKYWDDVVKANREAYEQALRNCDGSRACREAAAAKKGPQYEQTPVSGDRGEWVSGERGDGVFQPADPSKPPIAYRNGFPDLSPHAQHSVDIPMRGNHSTDFTKADQAVRDRLGDPDWRRPEGYTWHHKENGTTMELVPQDIHSTAKGGYATHSGGASLYKGQHAEGF